MPSTMPKRKTSININALFALMEPWPQSWKGSDADIPIGRGLVAEFKPFIAHLVSLGLTSKTVRRHLDSCWVIGGEEAPLVHDASEEEQRAFDTTARKLLHFLNR